MSRSACGFVLTLAVVLWAGHAAAEIRPFVAVYALSQNGLRIGAMERRFELPGDGRYRFVSRMYTTGIAALFAALAIDEESRGRVAQGKYAPEHYVYRHSRKHKQFSLRFDHARAEVERADGGWRASAPPDVQDKLAYQIQLMADLAAGLAAARYTVADKNKLKDYRFERDGEEDIATAMGPVRALKLERIQTGSARRTTIWAAATLDWLPVRVDYQEKDGNITSAVLEKFTPSPL